MLLNYTTTNPVENADQWLLVVAEKNHMGVFKNSATQISHLDILKY